MAKNLTGYGQGGFKLDGEFMAGSLLLFGDFHQTWTAQNAQEISSESLAPLLDQQGIELLLIGTGEQTRALPENLRQSLRTRGIALEVMDSSAACRTYNVLQQEERKVALAAIAI